MENGGKIFHQLAKVHAPVRSKIKNDIAIIEEILRLNQMHGQFMRQNTLLTDPCRFRFKPQILFIVFFILFIGKTKNGSADQLRAVIRYKRRFNGTNAKLAALLCLNDHRISIAEVQPVEVKIPGFPPLVESHSDDFYHIFLLSHQNILIAEAATARMTAQS